MKESILLISLPLFFSFIEYSVPYFGGYPVGVEIYNDKILVFAHDAVYGFRENDGNLIFKSEISNLTDYAMTPQGFVIIRPGHLTYYAVLQTGIRQRSDVTIPCDHPLYVDESGCYACNNGVGCGSQFIEKYGPKSPPIKDRDSMLVIIDDQLYKIRNGKVLFQKKVGYSSGVPFARYQSTLLIPVENKLLMVSPNNGQVYKTWEFVGWISSLKVVNGEIWGSTYSGMVFHITKNKMETYQTSYSILNMDPPYAVARHGVVILEGKPGLIPSDRKYGSISTGKVWGTSVYALTDRFLLKISPSPGIVFRSPYPYRTIVEGAITISGYTYGGNFKVECHTGNRSWVELPPTFNWTIKVDNFGYGEIPITCKLKGVSIQSFTLPIVHSAHAPKKTMFYRFKRRVKSGETFKVETYDSWGNPIYNVSVEIGGQTYKSWQNIKLWVPGKYVVVMEKSGYYPVSTYIECMPPPVCTLVILVFVLIVFGFWMLGRQH